MSTQAFTPTYSGNFSFAGLPFSDNPVGKDLVVLGIPFDNSVSNRPGCRLGPRSIRNVSSMCSWEKPYGWDFNVFHTLKMCDMGDLKIDYGRQQDTEFEISGGVQPAIDANVATLCMGGDHFISYPLIKQWANKIGQPLSLLQFDSHTDTWADTPDRIDHGSMFYHATQSNLIDPGRSVQVGIRTSNADTLGFNIIDAVELQEIGICATAQKISELIGKNPVYITFDIDFLDPAYAPGTGTPACGGPSTFQALQIIRNLKNLNIVGFDVVEVSPPYDHAEITALAAASVMVEFMSLYAHTKKLNI